MLYFYNAGPLILSSIKYNLSTFYLNFYNLNIIERTNIATPEYYP
jgi:hypothetical protein